MINKVTAALPAFVVAMLGVGFALLWFRIGWWFPLILVTPGLLLGYGADALGKRLLPDRPLIAVRVLEWWVVFPGTVAALAAGVAIVVAVELVPDDDWSPQNKEILTAIVAAISTLLAVVILKGAEEADSNWIAPRIRKAFFESFERQGETKAHSTSRVHHFPPESDGERWIHSDPFKGVEGWGRTSRLARARGVKDALLREAANQEAASN